MVKTKSKTLLFYDNPATYQICVQGQIDLSWSDRLEGMTIVTRLEEDNNTVSTLEGELSDQAALAGVLNTLYELRLPVIIVKRLNP